MRALAPADLLEPENFDELQALLDELRTRDEEIPQWGFCEGVLAALVCRRRAILQRRVPDRPYPHGFWPGSA